MPTTAKKSTDLTPFQPDVKPLSELVTPALLMEMRAAGRVEDRCPHCGRPARRQDVLSRDGQCTGEVYCPACCRIIPATELVPTLKGSCA